MIEFKDRLESLETEKNFKSYINAKIALQKYDHHHSVVSRVQMLMPRSIF